MNIFGSYAPKLYVISLTAVVELLQNITNIYTENEAKRISLILFQNIGVRIVEDIMTKAFYNECVWKHISQLFHYPKITRLICKWDENLLLEIKEIKTLRQILITEPPRDITVFELLDYVKNYGSVDLDGELFWRGQPYQYFVEQVLEKHNHYWFTSSQSILKFLMASRQKVPKYVFPADGNCLTELHLGDVSITTEEISKFLLATPNLLILRSYKLVKALYELHKKEWKAKEVLVNYRLRNLDADFSYVGRCTLKVEPMLPLDALQLAIDLCPEVHSIRVRIDCSTHHDILLPLKTLSKLKEFSVVCVTNGERSLLNFTDIEPVLMHHGKHLKTLELKVIDEIDTHIVTRFCPKLEVLILSGSDYVTRNTCAFYQCSQSSASKLNKLKILFFAEGGDIVCSNNVPQCFWYSTLGTSEESCSRLNALFLESPRIPELVVEDILKHTGAGKYPNLQIISLCRSNELDINHLRTLTSENEVKYVQLSQCQKLNRQQVKRWQQLSNRYDILVYAS